MSTNTSHESATSADSLAQQLLTLRLGRPWQDELAERYVTRGQGIRTISAELGFCPETIRSWLKDAGVSLRPRGRRKASAISTPNTGDGS